MEIKSPDRISYVFRKWPLYISDGSTRSAKQQRVLVTGHRPSLIYPIFASSFSSSERCCCSPDTLHLRCLPSGSDVHRCFLLHFHFHSIGAKKYDFPLIIYAEETCAIVLHPRSVIYIYTHIHYVCIERSNCPIGCNKQVVNPERE